MGWGTAEKFYSYQRKCQAWVGWEQTANTDTQATIKVTGCARSGDGSGYYYAYDFGVSVRIFYRIDGGSWHELKRTTTVLNYGAEVGTISASFTVNRTHAKQVVEVATEAVSTTSDWDTATARMSTTINAKTSYTITLNANKPSAASADVANMPSNQTKWYGCCWHGNGLRCWRHLPRIEQHCGHALCPVGTRIRLSEHRPSHGHPLRFERFCHGRWHLRQDHVHVGNRHHGRRWRQCRQACGHKLEADHDGQLGRRIKHHGHDLRHRRHRQSCVRHHLNGYVLRRSNRCHRHAHHRRQRMHRLPLSVAMGTAATQTGAFELAMDFDHHDGGVTLDATAKAAWLAALGLEFGTYSGTVNVTSSWYGMYFGAVTIPITARADTSYHVQATATCPGNLVWCSVNSKGTSSFEVFVISPRNSAQAVTIDWMIHG